MGKNVASVRALEQRESMCMSVSLQVENPALPEPGRGYMALHGDTDKYRYRVQDVDSFQGRNFEVR